MLIVCIACNACSNYIHYSVMWCTWVSDTLAECVDIWAVSKACSPHIFIILLPSVWLCMQCLSHACICACEWERTHASSQNIHHTVYCFGIAIQFTLTELGTCTLLPITHMSTSEWCFTERVIMYSAMSSLHTACTIMHAYKFFPHTWWDMQ